MASIQSRPRRDGSTVYRVMFRDQGQQRSETFTEPGPAAEFRRMVERLGPATAVAIRDARSNNQANRPTVTVWLLDHIEHLTGVTDGTRSDYRSYVHRDIAPEAIGELPVDLVLREHVEGWVNVLSKRLGGKSIRNRHSLLSAGMTRAVMVGVRQDNPCRGVRLPESEKQSKTFLTPDDFTVLISYVDRHYEALVALLYGTGLRWGEATALRVEDFRMDDRFPVVLVSRAWKHTDGAQPELGPPKTRKAVRTVSLAPNLVPLLRPLVDNRPGSAFVFVNRQGQPIRHNTFYVHEWRKAVDAANDPEKAAEKGLRVLGKRPRIHDLRHSHASNMIGSGMDLAMLQRRLGHESIKTTVDVYGHLLPDHLEMAAAFAGLSLDQAFPLMLEV